MTIRIHTSTGNRENRSAEDLRAALISSAPELEKPEIELEILPGLILPGGELDLVLLFYDQRSALEQFKSSKGHVVHSFVLIIEVKLHSPELVKFSGPRLLVRYEENWHDASAQCDRQTYALKNYQKAALGEIGKKDSTFVQRAIWLPRVPRSAFATRPATSGIPVHFSDLTWVGLIDAMDLNHAGTDTPRIATLVDQPQARRHDLSSLRQLLTHEILPTQLDLRRINTLTQTRFDAEKTAYIRNLGQGLLTLRGRGGTGKTFSLVQIALHLARTGKRTAILTYNHGLIADISRSLKFIAARVDGIDPLPRVQTRYSFIQDVFIHTFGKDAEDEVRRISNLEDRENVRQQNLATFEGEIDPGYDFVLIDEGQDWKESQRDLIFRLFGPGRVVVADGVDQFVDASRCNWDSGNVPINRRHTLRSSRRTKGSTCQTVAEIAKRLGIADWDLEPDPDAFGGKFTVLVEADASKAIERGLALLTAEQARIETLRPVDDLICLPSSKMADGMNYPVLLERQIEASGGQIWKGYDEKDRRVYPLEQQQVRAIQYASCRGMEGWSTLCLALDRFFDFQLAKPQIDKLRVEMHLRDELGLLLTKQLLDEKLKAEAWLYAVNWLMIPLTRSIDHMVVHIVSKNSQLGHILSEVSEMYPGTIEWLDQT